MNLRTEVDKLRDDAAAGFEKLTSAINGLRSSGTKKGSSAPVEKPVISEPPKPEQQITLGPAIVQHLQVSQRRAVSNKSDVPYAIQVILQTDVPTQPTAFLIECNADIEEGKFFVTNQPVMMGVGFGVQADKKKFYFRFNFPSFTPESPIVVTLTSKSDIRVVAVNKAN